METDMVEAHVLDKTTYFLHLQIKQNRLRIASLCLWGAILPVPAFAVYSSSEAVGQALIYPYYTTQTSNGDSYNTYITVVNQATDVKAVRVRFREGRAGPEVASFTFVLTPAPTSPIALPTLAGHCAPRV